MGNNISVLKFLPDLSGSYDNFLQIWKEQTEDEIHQDKRGYEHEHIHVKFKRIENHPDQYNVSFYKGRNNQYHIIDKIITFETKESKTFQDDAIILSPTDGSWQSSDQSISIESNGSIISIKGLGIYPEQMKEPYKLAKCRFFSGFIEYPLPGDPETVHRLGNLETHDQGGMVELNYEGVDYTVELTQLIFAHKIELMKVAIYDLPMKEVDINSKAISYTWSSPESKRLGINIRRLISGWTFIEDGFINSNNMDLDT